MKNLVLKKAISGVVESHLPASFSMHVELNNSTNKKYQFIPTFVKGLQFIQDPTENYCDNILLFLTLSGNEYSLLYEHIQDMYCHLTFHYLDVEGHKFPKIKPIKKKYRVALQNPQDIRKIRTDVHYYKEAECEATLRLIEEKMYEARSIQLNGIYRRTTLTDVLHHLGLSFGYKDVTVEKATNMHIYDHIIIPPMKNFGDCFPYIQEEYGVYEKGLTYFVTHDNLFIYAPFNLTPDTLTKVNIYQNQLNMSMACGCTTKVSKDLVEIVINEVEHGSDHSVYGAENEGTSYTFLRSSEVQDGVITYHPKLPTVFKNDSVLTIGLAEPKTLTKKTTRPHYATTTDNIFCLASNVYEKQSTHVRVSWVHSLPFALRPGLQVNYYWDDNGKLKKKTGILESLGSNFIPTQLGAVGTNAAPYVFRATSILNLRLLPEEVTVKNITKDTPSSKNKSSTQGA